VVGTDGQPQGPHPPVHILPCPYYTRPWRADSSYRRGERGEDAGWWTLVVARPLSLQCIGDKPCPYYETVLPPQFVMEPGNKESRKANND